MFQVPFVASRVLTVFSEINVTYFWEAIAQVGNENGPSRRSLISTSVNANDFSKFGPQEKENAVLWRTCQATDSIKFQWISVNQKRPMIGFNHKNKIQPWYCQSSHKNNNINVWKQNVSTYNKIFIIAKQIKLNHRLFHCLISQSTLIVILTYARQLDLITTTNLETI